MIEMKTAPMAQTITLDADDGQRTLRVTSTGKVPMTASVSQQVFTLGANEEQNVSMDVATAIQTVSGNHYTGPYEATPKAEAQTVLETNGKFMDDDVTILEIPYYETSNLSGGKTAYIADEV